jgi:Arc/MetJ-type ribon-helix-helix transcriptional regulator
MPKCRISASVDASLLKAAELAVAEGRFSNLSAWVNAAMQLQTEHDRRVRALDTFVATYEQEQKDEQQRKAKTLVLKASKQQRTSKAKRIKALEAKRRLNPAKPSKRTRTS